MSLTKSNLYSEGFSIWNSFLKNNITDPRGRYKDDWIHASMPNINSKGFSGYPFIILSINIEEDNNSFDGVISQKIFRILISVFSDEATDVDSISNSIYNSIKDETKLTEFKVIRLDSSNFNWDLDKNGKKIIFRDIDIIARSRI